VVGRQWFYVLKWKVRARREDDKSSSGHAETKVLLRYADEVFKNNCTYF
jgi:hypothetical protein